MNLIAIHTGHNAGVAVFKEGHLVSMVTEDKWTNVKNQAGFPFQSLRDATIFFNHPSDIDKAHLGKLQAPTHGHWELPAEQGSQLVTSD